MTRVYTVVFFHVRRKLEARSGLAESRYAGTATRTSKNRQDKMLCRSSLAALEDLQMLHTIIYTNSQMQETYFLTCNCLYANTSQ